MFGKPPLWPLPCAGNSSSSNFPFVCELVQELRAGSRARTAWHSRVGIRAEQDCHKGTEGTCLSSLQAVTGAEGQHDLFR